MDENADSVGSHKSIMIEYFNKNCFDILQSINLYIRKQLKVPDYSQLFEDMGDDEQMHFQQETALIFKENPLLQPKLEKLQMQIIKRIFNIIDMDGSEVKVSLLVYSSFKQLASTSVLKDWRGLEMLREVRSFNPNQD